MVRIEITYRNCMAGKAMHGHNPTGLQVGAKILDRVAVGETDLEIGIRLDI